VDGVQLNTPVLTSNTAPEGKPATEYTITSPSGSIAETANSRRLFSSIALLSIASSSGALSTLLTFIIAALEVVCSPSVTEN